VHFNRPPLSPLWLRSSRRAATYQAMRVTLGRLGHVARGAHKAAQRRNHSLAEGVNGGVGDLPGGARSQGGRWAHARGEHTV